MPLADFVDGETMNRLIAPVIILLASAVPAFASTIVVPEPATMAVLGAGIGGVYLIRRFTGRK
jgi:hypothetical protein